MPDRRQQILQLLATRYDGLYQPPGSLTTPAGLVAANVEPCTSCGGTLIRDDFGHTIRRRKGRGTVRDRYGRPHECTTCAGAGEVARDPMDAHGVRVGSTDTTSTARPRHRKTCDRCNGTGVWKRDRCTLCDGEGRRDVHVFELRLDDGRRDTRDAEERMADAIDARNQAGSYREIERALAMLRARNRAAHAALLAAVDQQLVPFPGPLEPVLAFLDQRMPDPIRVPVDVRANARERREWARRAKGRSASPQALENRDREIRQALRKGAPTQRVAFEYGLSVSQVNRIVAGHAA